MYSGMSKFKAKWQAWRALPVSERRQLLRLLMLLPMMHASLALAGYARTRRWCERLSDRPTWQRASAQDIDAARRLTELAAIAGRHGITEASCLRQALVVSTLLRRRGLDAKLQIGVQRDGETFGAHAWVEVGGESLQVDTRRYRALHRTASDQRDA